MNQIDAREPFEAGRGSRPLWKKKRFVIPAGLLALFVFAGVSGGDSEPTDSKSASANAREANAPAADPAKAAADKAAAAKAAADKAAADKAASAKAAAAAKAKIDNAAAMTPRNFALLVKDPESHKGEVFRIFGEVFQFDAATGDDQFLADAGPVKSAIEYNATDYDQRALFTGKEDKLADVVEGDVFSAVVEVQGTESYDTQIGGSTTVPKFKILAIDVYGSTK